jgi:hypothetical protein
LYGSKSLVGVLIFAVPVNGGKLATKLLGAFHMCTATARGKAAGDQDFASGLA